MSVAAGEDQSFVVEEKVSGRLAACLLADDITASCTTPPEPPAQLLPVQALLAQLESMYSALRLPLPGRTLLVDIAVVGPADRGCGLYSSLRRAAHEIGAARGLRYVAGELTATATQKFSIDKLGHRVIGEICFADFQYNGERPFATIVEHRGAVFVNLHSGILLTVV